MKDYSQSSIIRTRARQLRKQSPLAERLFWSRIRNSKIKRIKFRRQFPIHHYILDFYCEEKKIAIELDGESHETDQQWDYDKERTTYLEQQRIQVIRITNEEIYKNLDEVVEWLTEIL